MSDDVSTPEFGKLRKMLFPIHGFEVKKALPMGIMFFLILFNYTCLRNLKDAIVITAPNSGAEVLSFLKAYLVMPGAILFMLMYAKGSDVMSNEKLFYVTVGAFIAFFAAFGFIIYPNLDVLHPSVQTVAMWQSNCSESLRWPIAIIGNWSYALFFVMAELWGAATLSLLFWQFANQICKVSEAKRFYAFFGLMAQFSLFFAGEAATYFSNIADKVAPGVDPWGVSLHWLMGIVFCSGIGIMAIYRWIYKYVLTDKRLYEKAELPGAKKKKSKIGFWQSMKVMVTSPYLGLIAALVICYGIGINVIEGLWKSQVRVLHPKASEFNIFMGNYVKYTGIVSIFIMIIGGNILRAFSWFTSAVNTPVMTLIAGSAFFAFVLWRDSFSEILAKAGTNPVAMAAFVGATILILAKATKYALFDLTKEIAYISLDEEMKVKGKVVVEVVGGRLGKGGGAWLQSGLLLIFGFFSSRTVRLMDIAPYLFGILVITCIVWVFAVKALSKKIAVMTAVSSKESKI